MAEMEEKAGVDLDWQIYYNSDWSEQKSLLLASGELPDAFVGSICLNSSDMAQNKDYFVDLTPYINEETMPNLTKAMEECPELRAACTDRDGKIYSLPKKLPLRPTVWPLLLFAGKGEFSISKVVTDLFSPSHTKGNECVALSVVSDCERLF